MDLFEQMMPVTVTVIVLAVVPTLLLALAIPYAVLRLRDTQSTPHDNQVGLKAALYFFSSVGIMLILNGGFILVLEEFVIKPQREEFQRAFAAAKEPDEFPNQTHRVGFGLATAGAVLTVFHWLFIMAATNDGRFPSTRRLFGGWRFAIDGMIVTIAVIALALILWQKEGFMGDKFKYPRRITYSALMVFAPAWLLEMVLLLVRRDAPYGPSSSAGRASASWES